MGVESMSTEDNVEQWWRPNDNRQLNWIGGMVAEVNYSLANDGIEYLCTQPPSATAYG